jgi:hypothetical protein
MTSSPIEDRKLRLNQLGCPDYDTVEYGESLNPPAFNWLTTFGSALVNGGPLLPTTIVVSLALYALVRAIGWIIGGFAAS